MICRFCRKDVETPCPDAANAMMRCEVSTPEVPNNVAVGQQVSPIQSPPSPKEWQDNVVNTYPDIHPNRYERAPSERAAGFHFDDNILMLLKEARSNLSKGNFEPTMDEIWIKAKEISSDYEVVMKPTLKKRT